MHACAHSPECTCTHTHTCAHTNFPKIYIFLHSWHWGKTIKKKKRQLRRVKKRNKRNIDECFKVKTLFHNNNSQYKNNYDYTRLQCSI